MLISIIRFSIFSPINLQPAERSKLTAAGLSRHVTEPRTHRARTLAIYLERRAATRAEFIIKSCSVLVYLVTVKGAQCSTSSLRPPLNNVSASEYRQHRLTRNCAKGKIFKQEMQLTPFLNRVTLKCTGRARAAAVHVAARAAVIACRELCTHRCDILTSLRLRHFPFALMRGRGSTKDFAFFLTPSLHRPRTGASAACLGVFFFFFCNKDAKMQNTSLDLHALGAFLRPERACPCKERWYKCTAPAAVGKTGNSAIALQRILRSTYMMGQGWQLKAPNLDQCEPLRENVLPAWSAEDAGKCSPGGDAANSSQLIYLLCAASVQ